MRQLHFQRLIGSGSFGKVYAAELLAGQDFRRTVAVKVLIRPDGDDALFVGRVRDEARLLGLLEHDHILKVQELLTVDGRDAVVMELVDGLDLGALVAAGQRPTPRALAEIGAAVAGALAHAHAAVHPQSREPLHVIHRDVKPANVMITPRGGVKLLDFGVAKARFDARETRTGAFVLGTLNYMAPEYVVTGAVTAAVDIYGLALALWESVTAEPFGAPKMQEDLHKARVNERIERLPDDYAPLAPLLKEMFNWAADRRPDAAAVEAALARLADQLPGPGLRLWATSALPAGLAARPPLPADPLGLVGRTLMIESPSPTPLPAEPPRAAPPPPASPAASPVLVETLTPAPPPPPPLPSPPPSAPPRRPRAKGRSTRWMVLQGMMIGMGLGVFLLLVGLAVVLVSR